MKKNKQKKPQNHQQLFFKSCSFSKATAYVLQFQIFLDNYEFLKKVYGSYGRQKRYLQTQATDTIKSLFSAIVVYLKCKLNPF